MPLNRRPALPREIVLAILRLAGCVCRTQSLEYSRICDQPIVAHGSHASGEERQWFSFLITPARLERIAEMQLVTYSRDHGWGRRGEFSYFQIDLQNSAKVVKTRTDGSLLTWRSHQNSAEATDFQLHAGTRFGWDHEVWENLEQGDRVCVKCCAYYPGWQNRAMIGWWRVWEWFEPSFW